MSVRYASLRACLDDYARRFPNWKPDPEWVALLKSLHRCEEQIADVARQIDRIQPVNYLGINP